MQRPNSYFQLIGSTAKGAWPSQLDDKSGRPLAFTIRLQANPLNIVDILIEAHDTLPSGLAATALAQTQEAAYQELRDGECPFLVTVDKHTMLTARFVSNQMGAALFVFSLNHELLVDEKAQIGALN